jgi:hypothetical protein
MALRHFLAFLALGHGIAHGVGFVVPWKLVTFPEQPYRTTILGGLLDIGAAGVRVVGLVWLALAIAFVVTGMAVWTDASWWPRLLPWLALASVALCLLELPDTRFGLAANFGVLAMALAVTASPGAPVRNDGMDLLWRQAGASTAPAAVFDARTVAGLPVPVQRYLTHAIAPGTPLARAVRLRMHGEIKLGGTWRAFTGEEVIVGNRGMIWAASVPYCGVSIRGADRYVDGEGSMQWKLAGVVPVMTASGPDVSRSAAGRLLGELVWLPSTLIDRPWIALDGSHLRAHVEAGGESTQLQIATGPSGSVSAVSFLRWGDAGDGSGNRLLPFGVAVEEERTFSGYTIPSRIRAGWHFGTDRFDKEGEFFRCRIDDARFS